MGIKETANDVGDWFSDRWDDGKSMLGYGRSAPSPDRMKREDEERRKGLTTGIETTLNNIGVSPSQKVEIITTMMEELPQVIERGNDAEINEKLKEIVNRYAKDRGNDTNVAPLKNAINGFKGGFGPGAAANMFLKSAGEVRTKLGGNGIDDKNLAVDFAGKDLDKFVSNLGPNRIRIKIADKIKEDVVKLLENPALNGSELEAKIKETILKIVDENVEKPEPPSDPAKREKFDAEMKKDREALEKNAGTVAYRLRRLKESPQGSNTVAIFKEKMAAATPTLPISNSTLIAGAAAGGVMLAAGDAVGDWSSLKGIAIKLGIIGATMGVTAFINGDLTTSMFTGPKKQEDKGAGTTPT